jgi:hypothetical protein
MGPMIRCRQEFGKGRRAVHGFVLVRRIWVGTGRRAFDIDYGGNSPHSARSPRIGIGYYYANHCASYIWRP